MPECNICKYNIFQSNKHNFNDLQLSYAKKRKLIALKKPTSFVMSICYEHMYLRRHLDLRGILHRESFS